MLGSAVPHYDVFIEPELPDDRDSSVDLDLREDVNKQKFKWVEKNC